jgi:hypothetical protein
MKQNNASVIEKFSTIVDRLLNAKIKKAEMDTSFLYQLLLEIQDLQTNPAKANKSSKEEVVVSGGDFNS